MGLTNVLIDSHCHLDFSVFDQDRQDIIASCARLSIKQIVVPGTQASSWARLLELAIQHRVIKPAIGLHPYFLEHYQAQDLSLLSALIAQFEPQLVGLGEIGLDYAIAVDPKLQMRVFTQQLAVAAECKLPVILHHRRSHNDLIKTLKATKFRWGGIVHAFSGSLYEANTYQDLGFKLGVGGVITYARAGKTREVIQRVALDSLVLETDAPDMPPFGLQGQRNSPQNLIRVLDELCALREESRDVIIAQCYANTVSALRHLD